MNSKGNEAAAVAHPFSLDDVRPQMAKAVIKKVDPEQLRAQFGQIIGRAVELAGLIDKEAADRIGVHPATFSRWLSGKETAGVHLLHSDDLLGPALIAAQAEVTEGATVRTVIELRRKVG